MNRRRQLHLPGANVLAVLFLLHTYFFKSTSADKSQVRVTLRELYTDNVRMYFAKASEQSWKLPEQGVELNVMYPPTKKVSDTTISTIDDASLCSFPTWLPSANETPHLATRNNASDLICFLVPAISDHPPVCDMDQKAKTVYRIQTDVDIRVKCLIVYGGDTHLTTIHTSIPTQSLLVLSIPSFAGVNLQNRIEEIAQRTGHSPLFHVSTNNNWTLLFRMEYSAFQQNTTNTTIRRHFWIKICFIVVLISTAVGRLTQLWFVMGGRILWRRNDHGRIIVGLRYIAPMGPWLSLRRAAQAIEEPTCSTLTESQFDTLPKLNKMITKTDKETGGDQDSTAILEEAPSSAAMKAAVDCEETVVSSDSTTVCSICLEDYNEMESYCLVQLPRCRHVFHTECLYPWLTERQGCCPTCKTPVLTCAGDLSSLNERVSDDSL